MRRSETFYGSRMFFKTKDIVLKELVLGIGTKLAATKTCPIVKEFQKPFYEFEIIVCVTD